VGEEVVEFTVGWGRIRVRDDWLNLGRRSRNPLASTLAEVAIISQVRSLALHRKVASSHNELAEPIEAVLVASTFDNTAHE
jgi:hypothetical protein